jgi:hypothetical protein
MYGGRAGPYTPLQGNSNRGCSMNGLLVKLAITAAAGSLLY